jgi:hypothetical protein
MAAVAVDDVIAQVVGVLTRAESLFTAGDGPAQDAAGALASAAEVNQTLSGRTADLSGAGVSSHRQAVAQSATAMGQAAAADGALTRHLRGAAGTHSDGAGRAGHLRAGAAEIADIVGPLRGTAPGDMVVLKTLHARLAGMQQLVAEHVEHGSATAEQIRALGYTR